MLRPTLLITPDRMLQAQWSELPQGYGVYAICDGSSVVHLSWSVDLPRRLQRLLQSQGRVGETLRQQLAERQLSIRCWSTGSSLENAICIYEIAQSAFPADYRKRLRLRTPWFVGLTDRLFPYLTAINRADDVFENFVGPFPNREMASRYEEATAGLFQLRRCTDNLQPRPDHPGCIYGEMALCLRPCQLAVSEGEYASEVQRARAFLITPAEETVASMVQAREAAANSMEYETANAIHRRLEKIQAAMQSRHEVARPLPELNGIAVNLGVQPLTAILRPMDRGQWQEPVSLSLAMDDSRSLDSRLREVLSDRDSIAIPGPATDHLAIFLRWHDSLSKTGLWIPIGRSEQPPYRKLARGLSKLHSEGQRPGTPVNKAGRR